MSKKTIPVEDIKDVGSTKTGLFRTPVPYSAKPVRKCTIVVSDKDENNCPVVRHVCIEDEVAKQVEDVFENQKLDNLVSNGVQPKALDIHSTSKLGCDSGCIDLADALRENASAYVSFKDEN